MSVHVAFASFSGSLPNSRVHLRKQRFLQRQDERRRLRGRESLGGVRARQILEHAAHAVPVTRVDVLELTRLRRRAQQR